LPSFPGFGIETTADDIGAIMAAAAAGGIAVHAVITNIRKRRKIKEELEKSLEDKDIESQKSEGGE
jgi:hydrogenase small subunit